MESTLPEVLAKVYEEGDYMQYVDEGHYKEKLPDGSLRESLSCEEAVAIGLAAIRTRLEKVEKMLAEADRNSSEAGCGDDYCMAGYARYVPAEDLAPILSEVRSMLEETTT